MSEAQLHAHATDHLHHDRSGGMSEHELDMLVQRLWKKFEQHFENLGWDISTPAARERIRENNKWVDSWRASAIRAQRTAMGAGILAFVAGALALIWQAFKAAVTRVG